MVWALVTKTSDNIPDWSLNKATKFDLYSYSNSLHTKATKKGQSINFASEEKGYILAFEGATDSKFCIWQAWTINPKRHQSKTVLVKAFNWILQHSYF